MSRSILVVDDSADNRELAALLLECEGFEVRLAEDAAQALSTLQDYRPELILMDVQLPGMDGLELTRRLRQDPSLEGVVIVALSAYAMAAEKANAMEAGCDGYITKPINTRTFAATARQYLERPGKTVNVKRRSVFDTGT